jgi:hypothetical protein
LEIAMRYVILQHDWLGIHYDLMFEVGSALRTWRLDQPPQRGQPLNAVRSFDHRLLYLDYEGPVSGDRGHVKRWDAGTYEGDLDAPNPLRLRLRGNRWQGIIELRPVQGDQWELFCTDT